MKTLIFIMTLALMVFGSCKKKPVPVICNATSHNLDGKYVYPGSQDTTTITYIGNKCPESSTNQYKVTGLKKAMETYYLKYKKDFPDGDFIIDASKDTEKEGVEAADAQKTITVELWYRNNLPVITVVSGQISGRLNKVQ